MDELDRGIIELLQLDGRASNAKVAREVGVSEATVRRRLSRLIQQDVLRNHLKTLMFRVGRPSTSSGRTGGVLYPFVVSLSNHVLR